MYSKKSLLSCSWKSGFLPFHSETMCFQLPITCRVAINRIHWTTAWVATKDGILALLFIDHYIRLFKFFFKTQNRKFLLSFYDITCCLICALRFSSFSLSPNLAQLLVNYTKAYEETGFESNPNAIFSLCTVLKLTSSSDSPKCLSMCLQRANGPWCLLLFI